MNISKTRIIGWALSLLCGISPSALAAEAAPGSSSISIGTGRAKAGFLLQGWYWMGTVSPVPKNNFRLRRAEMKFSGEVPGGVSWTVMIDPSKSLRTGAISASNDNRVLQDLIIQVAVAEGVSLRLGQFKPAAAAEGLLSSSDLIFPERSLGARTYGDRREPGAELSVEKGDWKGALGVSNGQATNVDDVNSPKDFHLRAEGEVIEDWSLGAYTTLGDGNYETRARWGLNAFGKIDRFELRGEALRAKESRILGWSGMGQLAYALDDRWKPALGWNALFLSGVIGQEYQAGVSYFFNSSKTKATLAYSYLQNLVISSGSNALASGQRGSLWILLLQASI